MLRCFGDHYLVNSRPSWTTHLLNKTGDIIWRFSVDDGGDFGPPPDKCHFRWKHFVRLHNVTNDTLEISMFDNEELCSESGAAIHTNRSPRLQASNVPQA